MKGSVAFLPALVMAMEAASAQPPSRVAVLDIQSVLARTRDGRSATAQLEARSASKRKELDERENDIRVLKEKLRSETGGVGEVSRQTLYQDIARMTEKLAHERREAEAEWNRDRQSIFEQLGKRVMEAIGRYARDHGFTLVLDASPPQTPVVYAARAVDITTAIIELCDSEPAASAATAPVVGPEAKPSINPAAKQPPPRTPDGHPDLQGFWTNATMTLLERPPGLAWVLSEEEAAKYEKAVIADRSNDRRDGPPEVDVGRAYNDLFFDQGTTLARIGGAVRTALIVDPPDGHLPAYTLDASRRIAAAAVEAQQHPADRAQDRTLAERCLLWGAGPPMLPLPYNSNFQIVQTQDFVMILVEMMHDVRIIPLDDRPHLPSNVRLWMGDSRGHWEDDTLVVDTTNFTDKTRFQGTGEQLHVIERFQRVDPTTIVYRFTIEDPATFIRPWTAELPFVATPGPVLEFACHEGNYALRNILTGARAEERK